MVNIRKNYLCCQLIRDNFKSHKTCSKRAYHVSGSLLNSYFYDNVFEDEKIYSCCHGFEQLLSKQTGSTYLKITPLQRLEFKLQEKELDNRSKRRYLRQYNNHKNDKNFEPAKKKQKSSTTTTKTNNESTNNESTINQLNNPNHNNQLNESTTETTNESINEFNTTIDISNDENTTTCPSVATHPVTPSPTKTLIDEKRELIQFALNLNFQIRPRLKRNSTDDCEIKIITSKTKQYRSNKKGNDKAIIMAFYYNLRANDTYHTNRDVLMAANNILL